MLPSFFCPVTPRLSFSQASRRPRTARDAGPCVHADPLFQNPWRRPWMALELYGRAPPGATRSLAIEPHIFHAPAVERAVRHQRQPLDLRLTTGRRPLIVDDRPHRVL